MIYPCLSLGNFIFDDHTITHLLIPCILPWISTALYVWFRNLSHQEKQGYFLPYFTILSQNDELIILGRIKREFPFPTLLRPDEREVINSGIYTYSTIATTSSPNRKLIPFLKKHKLELSRGVCQGHIALLLLSITLQAYKNNCTYNRPSFSVTLKGTQKNIIESYRKLIFLLQLYSFPSYLYCM
jgi:hypothetical protein